jgi:transketolase
LIEGNDIAVFATGTMVGKAMDAAEILNYKGVKARVIDVSSIKPLDTESIDLAKETKLLVSIEEHSVIGGLGAAISEHIASKGGFPPLLSLGVKDRFGKVGDYNFQLEQNRLTSELIVDDITVRINGL